MEPNYHLIIHNVLSIISTVIITGVAFFTYLNGRRSVANVAFSLVLISAAIFMASNTIGVNIIDPKLSMIVLMFNLVIFPAAAIQVHATLAVIGELRGKKIILGLLYFAAAFIVIYFLVFPDVFLLPSVPKMYFPNYYNPGILNWTRVAFLYGIGVMYSIYELVVAYYRAQTVKLRSQYKYFIWSLLFGYIIIFIPNFLVYNIEIDPLFGTLFAIFFVIPFGYGAVKYEMFNVRVIAKQAFWYAIAVSIIGGLITLLNYMSNLIQASNPRFPLWTISLASAVLVVTISIVVWKKLRESDLLKYEFITTVTHKFRTPLTYIKWTTENLSRSENDAERKSQLDYIATANAKLVELTSVLMNVSETENAVSDYHMVKSDLSAIVEDALIGADSQLKAKGIEVTRHLNAGMYVICDASRLKFVIQTFIENAVQYSPRQSGISVMISARDGNIILSIRDHGIGIPGDELPLLFTKFYRGRNAKLADTEGMGIGLFMSKEIVAKHHGKIWAESPGQDQGSTFSLSLPAAS